MLFSPVVTEAPFAVAPFGGWNRPMCSLLGFPVGNSAVWVKGVRGGALKMMCKIRLAMLTTDAAYDLLLYKRMARNQALHLSRTSYNFVC